MEKRSISQRPIKEVSSDELVEAFGVWGEEKIHAELLRRNTEALDNFSKNSGRYSDIMIVFTSLLFILATFQLIATLQSLDQPWYVVLFIILVVFGVLFLSMKKLFDWFEERHPEQDSSEEEKDKK